MPNERGGEREPPPIIYFDYVYSFGGAQRSTATLLNWLSERAGRTCLFISPSPPHPKFAQFLRADRIALFAKQTAAFEQTQANRLRFLAAMPQLLRRLSLVLRERRLDRPLLVTSSHKGLLTLALYKLANRTRCRIVFYARGEAAPGQISRLEKFLLTRLFSAILCVSRTTRSNLISLGVPAAKVHVVYTSVDSREILERDTPPPRLDKPVVTILFVGSLIPTKGLHHLIGALRHVHESSRLRIRVAGGVPNPNHEAYARSLRQQAADLSPQVDIEWCGWVQDVKEMICQADIVCLPSYTEGFPRIVVESMASGRIVLSSAVGGVPELIDDGETGYIIPLDEQGIADILNRLLSAQDTQIVGWQARKRIEERYSLDVQGKLVIDALAE